MALLAAVVLGLLYVHLQFGPRTLADVAAVLPESLQVRVGDVIFVVVGLAVGCLALLGSLRGPIPDWIRRPAATARFTLPILHGGVAACTLGRSLPGSDGLRRQLLAAAESVERAPSTL